ncbi:MAG: adenosylmethionine--8-amino-7-oxononanoate transaminase [Legionellales bacterium]|nr:adenosylmethionine--8-amino-7-oxononanoate transaminase [Legionellales bacterium]
MSNKTLWRPYTPMGSPPDLLSIVDTQGPYLTLADGKHLLDAVGSWWTCIHGYRPAPIIEAMHTQLDTVPHVMLGGCHHPVTYSLVNALAEIAPADLNKVFLCDSGSISVEVAMKMAIQHFANQGQSQRRRFVSFYNGYHGDTFGAMSVCDPEEGMHQLFAGVFPEQFIQSLPTTPESLSALEACLERHHQEIAGMIVEPLLQGAGGMQLYSPAVLTTLRALCDRYGILLIADEIFTGFGRLGQWWACDIAKVSPDIMCVGKGLTAGVISLAATLCSEKVFAPFDSSDPNKALMHGPTYMGNPLACSAALANIDYMRRIDWQSQVSSLEQALHEMLLPAQKHPAVKSIRTKGAMGVIELNQAPPSWHSVQTFAISQGVWLRPFGNIIYTTPPYNLTPTQCDKITHIMIKSLDHL